MVGRDESNVITHRIKVEPTKTESVGDAWWTNGKVSIELRRGNAPAFGTLEFPYEKAANEGDARRQIAPQLERIVQVLAEALQGLSGR